MDKEKEKQKAREDAYRLISYRDRSESELRKRLLKKGHTKKIINDIIPRIKELGYIDDRRFAGKWVRHKVKHSPKGRYLLRAELKQKGVDSKIIEQALNREYPYELELKTAIELAEKWLSKSRNRGKEVVKLKVYLKNKGFNYDLISDTIDSIDYKQT